MSMEKSIEARNDQSDSIKTFITECMESLKADIKSLKEEYRRDFKSLHNDVSSMKAVMCTKSDLTKLNDNLTSEIGGVKSEVSSISTEVDTMNRDYDDKLATFEERINNIKSGVCNHETKEFAVETTCMISKIKKDSGENLKQKCTNLLKDGLGLPEIEIVSSGTRHH